MPHLSIRLLGPFGANLDGTAIARFHSDKVRALLAYLCVEYQGNHRREKLAGLLWPDYPESTARTNLRNALANLRKVIGDRRQPGQSQPSHKFLKITRQTIQFNMDSDSQIDARDFLAVVQAPHPSLKELAGAVDLFQGEFMDGFSLPGSDIFEEWLLLQRERFNRLALDAMHRLASDLSSLGEYKRALDYAWRQVDLDPLRENAQRQLMRLLAYNNQDSQAMAQYDTFRNLLAKEIKANPSNETTEVYRQIRDGTFFIPQLPTTPPSFLTKEEEIPAVDTVFVGRGTELAQLDLLLDQTLAGQGQVVFIIGEPGSGKSALAQEFVRRAMDLYPELISVTGRCNAFDGLGDPYLPFLEILQALSGDIETKYVGGEISRRQACRLWERMPDFVRGLLNDGPDLIDRFVAGDGLLARARAGATSEATQLTEFLERRASADSGSTKLQQTDLFEQYTSVLKNLSREHPLILILDDLQWADPGSTSLLFHLGKRLAGSHLLLVGAYRPEGVAQGRAGEEGHPLETVVREFQRDLGDIHINMAESDGKVFVEEYLASEPNRLDPEFLEELYRYTRGHPLFTVELLRSMQERGGLIRDDAGYWVTGLSLNWDSLPLRVEAVIAERLDRLPKEWQSLLAAASVEGDEFTAEAVALVLKADQEKVLKLLSGPLSQMHKLVQAQEFSWQNGQHISRYRFRHILFQIYLYNKLDLVQQAHIHQALGNALEDLHGEEAGKLAVPLARHFEGAGMIGKAVEYLLQAGDRAVRLFANDEAIAHFRHGLELVETLETSPQRDQLELTLLLALGVPLVATHGFSGAELAQTYGRARQLTRNSEACLEVFQALVGMKFYFDLHGDLQEAIDITEDIRRVAGELNDPGLSVMEYADNPTLVYLGEHQTYLDQFQRMCDLYDPARGQELVYEVGIDTGIFSVCHAGWANWFLGFPDQARQHSDQAIEFARERGHPFLINYACMYAAFLSVYRRDADTARELAKETIVIASEQGYPLWLGGGLTTMGWALGEEGQVEEGIRLINLGREELGAIGARLGYLQSLTLLAETYRKAGRVSEGLVILEEAQELIRETGCCMEESEVHRLQGELLLLRGEPEPVVEETFQRAVEVARRQGARSWELRATMSLCRLWQQKGKVERAQQMLAEIYDWFSEGFGTSDLIEAKRLIREL